MSLRDLDDSNYTGALPTIIERQDSQTPFLEGTHLGIKRVEARTGFDQSD